MVKPHDRALPLRVGTRGSPLALIQTRGFLAVLTRFCPVLRDMNVFEEHAIRSQRLFGQTFAGDPVEITDQLPDLRHGAVPLQVVGGGERDRKTM